MNAAIAHSRQMKDMVPQGPGNALVYSVLFHACVIGALMIGMPRIHKPEILDTPVPIEIVNVGEVTTTNRPPVEAPKPKEPPPEPKPVQRTEAPPPKPAPPKVTAKEPPKAVPPKPPEPKPVEKKPEPAAVPPPDAQVLEPPKETPKPPEPPPPQPEPQENTQEAFDSLLRNLQDNAPAQPVEAPVVEELEEPPLPSPIGDFSKELLVSELDALRQQLSQCWSIQAGARYAENLVVEVRLTINRDRTVQNAVIEDRWRYNQDPAFRAAADSAVRAVLSPMCTPLRLPPEKYEGWKDIIVSFDPKDML